MPFFHLHLVQQIIMNKPFGVDMCVCVYRMIIVCVSYPSQYNNNKKIVACHLSFSSPVVLQSNSFSLSHENIHQQSNCHGNPRSSYSLKRLKSYMTCAPMFHLILSPISHLNRNDKERERDRLEHIHETSLHQMMIMIKR